MRDRGGVLYYKQFNTSVCSHRRIVVLREVVW